MITKSSGLFTDTASQRVTILHPSARFHPGSSNSGSKAYQA
jgi:hypothetical protein